MNHKKSLVIAVATLFSIAINVAALANFGVNKNKGNSKSISILKEKKVVSVSEFELKRNSKNKKYTAIVKKGKKFSDKKVGIIKESRSTKKAVVYHSFSKGASYYPYLQAGGNLFLRGPNTVSGDVNLFFPLLQLDSSDLIFTYLRFDDKSGPPFGADIYLGYRHLFLEDQLVMGMFGALGRKMTYTGNYFSQFTFGLEYWIKRFFIGISSSRPVGKFVRSIEDNVKNSSNPHSKESYNDVTITTNKLFEKATAGFDFEVGYEFIDGLVFYVGGYSFNAKDVYAVYGPKARLTYDLFLRNKIFDKIGFEAGVQSDKQRGTVWRLGLNVRFGLWTEEMRSLQGVSRHMVDLVRK